MGTIPLHEGGVVAEESSHGLVSHHDKPQQPIAESLAEQGEGPNIGNLYQEELERYRERRISGEEGTVWKELEEIAEQKEEERGRVEASVGGEEKKPGIKERDIDLFKQLSPEGENSIRVLEELQKLGYEISENTPKNPVELRELGKLINSPYALDAIGFVRGISRWEPSVFFTGDLENDLSSRTSILSLFAEYIDDPNFRNNFSPDYIKKVNILSVLTGTTVRVQDIRWMEGYINDNVYLEFILYLSKKGLLPGALSSRGVTDFFSSLYYLRTGVGGDLLEGLLKMNHSGINLSHEAQLLLRKVMILLANIQDFSSVIDFEVMARELGEKLFDSTMKEFLRDSEKQEFAGILRDIRGQNLEIRDLEIVNWFFAKNDYRSEENLRLRMEVIGFLRVLKELKAQSLPLELLSKLVVNPDLTKIFLSREFVQFVKNLNKANCWVTPEEIWDPYDNSSFIADVFEDGEYRNLLMQDSTLEVVKAFGGHLHKSRKDLYIELSGMPNVVRSIDALKSLGFTTEDFDTLGNSTLEEWLKTITSDASVCAKLESPDFRNFFDNLIDILMLPTRIDSVSLLLGTYNDEAHKKRISDPVFRGYIKELYPGGLSLATLIEYLKMDESGLRLALDLKNKFNFNLSPTSWWEESSEEREWFEELLRKHDLRETLFSKGNLRFSEGMQAFDSYYMLSYADIRSISEAPDDFFEFLAEMQSIYGVHLLKSISLNRWIQIANDRDNFFNLLEALSSYGHNVSLGDIRNIFGLIPLADGLKDTLATLSEVIDYKFRFSYPQILDLESFIRKGYTREHLIKLKETYNRYVAGEFNITQDVVDIAEWLVKYEEFLIRLESYGYKFDLEEDRFSVDRLLQYEDKDRIFQVLDSLKENFGLLYKPILTEYYIKLIQTEGVEDKLRRIKDINPRWAGTDLDEADMDDILMFVSLGADLELFKHAQKLLSDNYFQNIRDASTRVEELRKMILGGSISDESLAKIFSVSSKATELASLVLLIEINLGSTQVAQNELWQEKLLNSSNFDEARGALTSSMVETALQAVYLDLGDEERKSKRTELLDLASKDERFATTLNIACRSIGIYGQKYGGEKYDEVKLNTLMQAIRDSIELNLERSKSAYVDNRIASSKYQFDNLFSGVSNEQRDRILSTWTDLSSASTVVIDGYAVSSEEAMLNRMNSVREMVVTDVRIHLRDLLVKQVNELEQQAKTNPVEEERLEMYKRYFINTDGEIYENIPQVYRSIRTFIRDVQAQLRDSTVPSEIKSNLGRSLVMYQSLAKVIKAFYRLESISEARYKMRKRYVYEIDRHVGDMVSSLKKLGVLSKEKQPLDFSRSLLESTILEDFDRIRNTLKIRQSSDRFVARVETTVDFNELAQAPDMTQSCQRLTEATDYNQAAYSRMLDGINEMVNIYRVGEDGDDKSTRLSRSFIELSKVMLDGEDAPRFVVLVDRQYTNESLKALRPDYAIATIGHLLDRLGNTPELSLIFKEDLLGVSTENSEFINTVNSRGYRIKKRDISGQYFANESNVKLEKYYDSFNGLTDVSESSWLPIVSDPDSLNKMSSQSPQGHFVIIEKI